MKGREKKEKEISKGGRDEEEQEERENKQLDEEKNLSL